MMEQPKLKKFKVTYRYIEYGSGKVIIEAAEKEGAISQFEDDQWSHDYADEALLHGYYDFISIEEVKEEKEEEE